tara:strand:- start:87 stop:482 length:396 start_codon:yes stop_codon:yes gene_type:complete
MAEIKTQIKVTSNQATASTPGPLTFALSLDNTDDLTVNGRVIAEVEEVAASGTPKIFDSSTTAESYIYLNNISDTNMFVTNSNGAGSAADRFMMLKAGEAAFFPWAGGQDLHLDHGAGSTKKCEYFIFVQA